MPLPSSTTGLAITNPLVLYRSLLATKRIKPDEAQYRLAIHLQKLYHRLKDYEPSQSYRHQLEQISLTYERPPNGAAAVQRPVNGTSNYFSRLRERKDDADSLALTRRLTSHEAALEVDSPQGLLLHGEVGTGKSMLVDLLSESLPNRKKRRVHFSTFMLDAFARLEHLRRSTLLRRQTDSDAEQSPALLLLARDLIRESPILFLDEFQLPDRAASKIVTNLFISFFQLGGVLVATSNRMPEELAKASGMEFPRRAPVTPFTKVQEKLFGRTRSTGRSESMFARQSDFSIFLEILKARCESWDMGGSRDWRRADIEISEVEPEAGIHPDHPECQHGFEGQSPGNIGLGFEQSQPTSAAVAGRETDRQLPKQYFLSTESITDKEKQRPWHHAIDTALAPLTQSTEDIPWTSASSTVYGRALIVPKTYAGVTMWTFNELCATNLGPADYITIASNFHTLILTDVPVLTLLQKNEARRFITLLDALYEARCKLLIQAAAGPDDIFFPETRISQDTNASANDPQGRDATYAETFSEIFQDQTSPFRPNIASYEPTASSPSYASSPLPQTESNATIRPARSILADEDSDFGPTYGAGRSASSQGLSYEPHSFRNTRGMGDGPPGAGNEIGNTPDFQCTSMFTGEDERFAYKRARSRLWEMCGARWWARQEEGWWKPLDLSARHWERTTGTATGGVGDDEMSEIRVGGEEGAGNATQKAPQHLFRHGASPFRTNQDPPPKIPWTHAWGMTKWGRRAGAWGQGVEGLKDRRQQTVDGEHKVNIENEETKQR